MLKTMSQEELLQLKENLEQEYQNYREKQVCINMFRGRPSADQLEISKELLEPVTDYHTADGTDARNYGGMLEGLKECRELFADLLGLDPDKMIIGGNSSLRMMYDMMMQFCLFGTHGQKPWKELMYEGKKVKWLCPVPGFDRHFAVCEEFGLEMIPIPFKEDGPDIEMIEELVKNDPMIKGIWCVPLYSNPNGICYSDEVVDRLATMETAAEDFTIFWDNAYAIHYIYEQKSVKNIMEPAIACGNESRIYYFFSTSKVTFPGAGIAMMASSEENIVEAKKHLARQTLGNDKMNQLRQMNLLKNKENMYAHMERMAQIIRPKFDMVLKKLEEAFPDRELLTWNHPDGGYFVCVDTLPGCAKEVVRLAKEAGVIMTNAGAVYPHSYDENDSTLRIAPTCPDLEELSLAMDIFCTSVKLASVNKRLEEKEIRKMKEVS